MNIYNVQNGVITKLFDHLHKSLENETEVGSLEVCDWHKFYEHLCIHA